jgi:hypothetical protein
MATAPAGGRKRPPAGSLFWSLDARGVEGCPVRLRVRSAVLQTAKVGFDSRTGYCWVGELQVVIAPGSALGLQNRRLSPAGFDSSATC